MPLVDICSGISFRYDDSIFVALAEPCWLPGGAEVVSLSFLGFFLFPTLLLVEDPAVADQFLKGETMTVHQVEAATTELQLHNLLLGLQLTGGCLYLVHHHGLPLEELVRHRRVVEGGEEEEAQEGEADNLRLPSQGQQVSGPMRPGGRTLPLGETPSAWTERAAETGTWG